MLRASLCSVAVLALFALCAARADDQKDQGKTREHKKATITKVDPRHGTVTVKMKDKSGKDVEKTFRLAEDIVYFDSTGRVAQMDIFKSGDDVLVLEREGKIKEMRKDKSRKSDDKSKASGGK